jgi:hypothetical protein
MLSRLAAILALGAGLAASPAWAACKISDIHIKSWKWHVENGDSLYVVGEAINGCAEPVKVEFQIVMRDAAGEVVGAQIFFSEGRAVPGGDSTAFEPVFDWRPKAKTVDLKIIDVSEP